MSSLQEIGAFLGSSPGDLLYKCQNSAKTALLLLVLLLSGCHAAPTTASLSGGHGALQGVVRYGGLTTDVNSLNPVLASVSGETRVDGAIFSGLVKFDDHQTIVPDLAMVVPSVSNGGISTDRLTIIYHLRHSVTWQDGTPFSASDVTFTFPKIADPKVNAASFATYSHVERISAPDDYTVVIRLKAPWAPAVERLFSGGTIIPRHLLDRSADFNHDAFGLHPIGTGPMRLQRWERSSRIVLVPNEHYFGGAPKVHAVEIPIVPDANTRLTLLKAKELDAAQINSPGQVADLRNLPGYHVSLVPNPFLRMLTFNVTRPPFSDVRVRQALALALDRPRLVQVTYLGTAFPARSLIPPFSWAYDDNNSAPAHDPQRANNLLTKAGWIRGPDGIRHAAGRSFSFTLIVFSGSTVAKALATQIQQAWREIGADVSILPQPLNVLASPTGLLTTGNFDVAVDSIVLRPDPDRTNILGSQFIGTRGANDARYASAESDRLAAQATAVYPQAERKPIYAELQRLWNRDLPYVPLAWEDRIYAVSSQLRNFKPEPIQSDLWNVEKWQI